MTHSHLFLHVCIHVHHIYNKFTIALLLVLLLLYLFLIIILFVVQYYKIFPVCITLVFVVFESIGFSSFFHLTHGAECLFNLKIIFFL